MNPKLSPRFHELHIRKTEGINSINTQSVLSLTPLIFIASFSGLIKVLAENLLAKFYVEMSRT